MQVEDLVAQQCAVGSHLAGYGAQTAMWVPRLRDLGHELVISAFYGLQGAPLTWEGIPVIPGSAPADPYGAQLLGEHAARTAADVVITLGDIWVLGPEHLKGVPVCHWMPVDCDPLGKMDKDCLRMSGAPVLPMSRFGARLIADALPGTPQFYVPHGIDTQVWKPSDARDEWRKILGLKGRFAIGINAANKDGFRKGMFEQFAAFAILHRKHPDTVMLVHAMVREQHAIDLSAITEHLGIADAVSFVDQYPYVTGQVPVEHLVNWYSALDLYSNAALGEGFGLTVVEANSCGIPAVVTDCSSMPEVLGSGWAVGGERFWNPTHKAAWVKPSIEELAAVYELAYERGPSYQEKKAAARESAMRYDVERVQAEFWKPCLDWLEPVMAERRAKFAAQASAEAAA
jgi:glycosyltransferase involved in cell wall biosynthesis